MKKIAFLISIGITLFANAQNNEQAFDWALNPGANNNILKALHYDSQGSLLVLASISDSASFGGNIVTSFPMSGYPTFNFFIGKRNTNGTSQIVLQCKNGATNGYSDFSDFNVDANDNIIIGGATPTNHDFGNGVTLSNKGYFITKYNNTGTVQWAKLYNFGNPAISSFTSSPWKISTLPNGDIIAILKESTRFAYIKLDANGNELIYKQFNISSNGSASFSINSSRNNCFIDNSGAFYLYINDVNNSPRAYLNINSVVDTTVSLVDSNIISNAGHPGVSYFLAFNNDGSKKYFKGFRGSIIDFAVEKVTGNVLLNWLQYGGQNNPAPMNTIAGNNGVFQDIYTGIVVIDSLGNYIKKSIDTPITEQLKLESILPLGNFKLIATKKWNINFPLIAGSQTYSLASGGAFTWFELDQNLVPNYFVAAPLYNQNSSLGSDAISSFNNKVAIGANWSAVKQQTINVNGTILVANDKNTSFPTHYNPPYNTVGEDLMIAQFDRVGSTSVSETLQELINFSVYPNPTTGTVIINSNNIKITSIQVLDITGKVVRNISSRTTTFDISDLTQGVYFLKINNSVTKLILQ